MSRVAEQQQQQITQQQQQGESGSKKVRIRKACDSCNVKRTKCDGNHPCAHCTQVKIPCTYLRQEKRRGRASEKYPKDIKKRKAKNSSSTTTSPNNDENSSPINGLGTFIIPSKKPDASIITHRSLSSSRSSFILSQSSRSNSTASINGDFQLGSTKYKILETISNELIQVGLPFEAADELFDFYFDEFYPPASKVFSILRHPTMLASRRPTKSNLLLAILLSSAVQVDNRFFTGSSRASLCKRMYEVIQNQLPSKLEDVTLDDFIVTVHLGFLMPWLSYPIDSVYWWEVGYEFGVALNLRTENPNDTEEIKEEKRRAWWGLYILDRMTAFCFNRNTIIKDEECSQLHLPGDESNWVHFDNMLQPAEFDPKRVRSIRFGTVSDGIYGWSLPLLRLTGIFVEYKALYNTHADQQKNSQLRDELIKLANQNLDAIVKNELNAHTASCPEKENSYSMDMSYARYINLVLTFILEDTQGWGVLAGFSNSTADVQISRIAQCVQVLEDIMKLDEDLHRYPFIFSFYLFLFGITILSMLNDINGTDNNTITEINRYKYYVKVLVRGMEAVMTTFPLDYLKMVRNQLISSIKDCENLLLLTDYLDKFKENTRKRKDALRAYSWDEGGRGIAI
ncbi:hypothetical protein BN7_3890 [Wickerhamomyces ciferrii]|uniref:Zn(2)-C6 fungal-type domain-containing protein n=1 Tax=Wickerhamomyces ciferrii (strain ATCC 14091 / BCRC 22168 / CBS 111 / JCM 3599 / NBRC 0793 / NRRL Y-1031 F-60-10) TaxID=1206466 RepID=K0KSM7_WICCF|nr:uncharacterized protein BN7_3890 [Wickerhamomyces ciferrii]CCH44328.1 hypothetical protein BN7_3890 [Wickerhamomyces ciferrii]